MNELEFAENPTEARIRNIITRKQNLRANALWAFSDKLGTLKRYMRGAYPSQGRLLLKDENLSVTLRIPLFDDTPFWVTIARERSFLGRMLGLSPKVSRLRVPREEIRMYLSMLLAKDYAERAIAR